MIKVTELTKDYGNRRAIDQISFQAGQGEIVGFLGPNGAGKTTTMRILTGYIPPTSGNAEIGGFDVFEKSLDVRKLVGYLPETVPLYPEMTVKGYLKYMADLRHLSNPLIRVGEVLELVQLTDRSNSYLDKLSKGMRQRVGLAQALVHQPQVLILDEPTIGLDPAQIIEVRHIIQQIGKEKTVLLSTHILSEAQQVCDRVLIINKGKIVAEDTPTRLQQRLVGSRHIRLTITGDIEDSLELIRSISGIAEVEQRTSCEVEFAISGAHDPRPELVKKLTHSNVGILEIREISISLEDIFLQLTRDDQPDPLISGQSVNESGPHIGE